MALCVRFLLLLSLLGYGGMMIVGNAADAADTPAASVTPVPTAPKVRVENIRRAFHNGEHNAFTDLCRFRDRLYLTFRSCPDGHSVHPTAFIIILSSADEGQSWEQVHRFSVPQRDTRDPHFLLFRDQLFVYTGTWWSGESSLPPKEWDVNKHLGFAVYSGSGTDWSEATILEGTFGFYIWRAAAYKGKAYLCGRRKPGFTIGPRGEGDKIQSLLLESDDGLNWKKCAYFNEKSGDETAFLFQPNGDLLAIGRNGGGKEAFLLQSTPPYAEWSRKLLSRPIGGPLVASWGDHILVGGRNTTPENGPKTTLWWLVNETLQPMIELPSAGDNSYPGFVLLSPKKALISWYSSHEKDEDEKPITAIYLAELLIE